MANATGWFFCLLLLLLSLPQDTRATWPFDNRLAELRGNWTKQTDHCRTDANHTKTTTCFDPSSAEITASLLAPTGGVHTLIVHDFDDVDVFDLCALANASSLQDIQFVAHELTGVRVGASCATPFVGRLRRFTLTQGRRLDSVEHVTAALLRAWPTSLTHLDLSNNGLTGPRLLSVDEAPADVSLVAVNLSRNAFTDVPVLPPSTTLRTLLLDHNRIATLNLTELFDTQPLLEELVLDANPIVEIPRLPAHRHLKRLSLRNLLLRSINLSAISHINSLTELNLDDNGQMERVFGRPVHLFGGSRRKEHVKFEVANCSISTFDDDFFSGIDSRYTISIGQNPLLCHHCHLRWLLNVAESATLSKQVACSAETRNLSAIRLANCSIGSSIASGVIVRRPYGSDALLRCQQFGIPPPSVTWYRVAPRTLLGSWNTTVNQASTAGDPSKHELLPGGTLLIHQVDLDDRGRYLCRLENERGENASAVVRFRLDYSSWFWVKVNSFICCVVTTIVFLVLDLIWTGIRKFILWRVSQAEKTSRVKKMLEAIEKYRQRQLEHLQEKYNNRVQMLRGNYHQQVEQLRQRYAGRTDRLRGYTATQKEAVTQHWDSMRDNYQQQVARMRDYGNRRADRLGESYERQMTRIRTFSLQQRLRLMRQYEIKQRYLNKILETLNLENAAAAAAAASRTEQQDSVDAETGVVDQMMTMRGWPPPLDDDDDPLGLLVGAGPDGVLLDDDAEFDREYDDDYDDTDGEDEIRSRSSTYHSVSSFKSIVDEDANNTTAGRSGGSRRQTPRVVQMRSTGTNTDPPPLMTASIVKPVANVLHYEESIV